MVLGIKMTNSALVFRKSLKFGLIIGNSPSLDTYRYEVAGHQVSYMINRKSMVSKYNPQNNRHGAIVNKDQVSPTIDFDDV